MFTEKSPTSKRSVDGRGSRYFTYKLILCGPFREKYESHKKMKKVLVIYNTNMLI
jgi:hypothetical protein